MVLVLFLWLLLVLLMRLLPQIMVFWGPFIALVFDVGLWCPSPSSTSTVSSYCLTSASTLLLTLHFGLTEWVSVSQWWSLPTFVHIEYENKMGICFVKSPAPTTPNFIIQVWLTLSKDRLTRIKFVMLYVKPKVWLLEPGIVFIHWCWNVIVWYRLSL